jgi:hypothetical protein
MPKFRKKPVVIEAKRLDRANGAEVAAWCAGELHHPVMGPGQRAVGIAIPTLEGVMLADEGDWIIRGVQGEFYPCKPDIFDATYELVENTDD